MLRTGLRAALPAAALVISLAVAGPAGANRLCVVNTDPDHSHRFQWVLSG
jgi:hypothetical protein